MTGPEIEPTPGWVGIRFRVIVEEYLSADDTWLAAGWTPTGLSRILSKMSIGRAETDCGGAGQETWAVYLNALEGVALAPDGQSFALEGADAEKLTILQGAALLKVLLAGLKGAAGAPGGLVTTLETATKAVMSCVVGSGVAEGTKHEDGIRCVTCDEWFDPTDLSEVCHHEHLGITDDPAMREALKAVPPGRPVPKGQTLREAPLGFEEWWKGKTGSEISPPGDFATARLRRLALDAWTAGREILLRDGVHPAEDDLFDMTGTLARRPSSKCTRPIGHRGPHTFGKPTPCAWPENKETDA